MGRKVNKTLTIRSLFFGGFILISGYTYPQQFSDLGNQDFFEGNRLINRDPSWYKSEDALNVAENVLLFQRNAGGWSKSNNYFKLYTPEAKIRFSNLKSKNDCTWDNSATFTELTFLARIYSATTDERFKEAFFRGFDLILEAQYENGGWPQYYPDYTTKWSWDNSHWNPDGLERLITYSDNAMTGLLVLLKNAGTGRYEYAFVDNIRKNKAVTAVKKGIECILKSQYYDNGRLTAWPAQVDEITFEPKWGRTFEPPSVASAESVGVIRFLMSIENPESAIIKSIQTSVKWLDEVKIPDTILEYSDTMTVIIYYGSHPNGNQHGRRDVSVKLSPGAAPLWSRFYELHTERPVFSSRNDSVYYKLSEINVERRSGTRNYGYWPQELLEKDYVDWCRKNKILSSISTNTH